MICHFEKPLRNFVNCGNFSSWQWRAHEAMSLARNQSSSLQRRMVRKSSFSSSPGAPRKDSRSPLSSREGSFNDGGPLNVTYELHRMHGTPRAARFLDFVTGKHSPEPFLCWTALEKLVEEVRKNASKEDQKKRRKKKKKKKEKKRKKHKEQPEDRMLSSKSHHGVGAR